MKDLSSLVTQVADATQVRELPKGSIVGDQVGGRSFTDNIAAALERRSNGGWQDLDNGDQRWTVIRIEK
jgi:hypothetical protein